MAFIDQIKKIKKTQGYTTERLAKESGIPLGTLSKLFSGVINEPKLSLAVNLAKTLGVSIDRLCDLSNISKDRIDTLVSRYSYLDEYGKELVDCVLAKEYERISASDVTAVPSSFTPPAVSAAASIRELKSESRENTKKQSATVLNPVSSLPDGIMSIPLYNLPVSAGHGEYLEDGGHGTINIRAEGKAKEAGFALKVSGNSMEPRFLDGDIILIKEQDSVDTGQFGIFICDGTGYFKQYEGDRLVSLNPEYSDIPLSSFSDVSCKGLVLGRLKSKKH